MMSEKEFTDMAAELRVAAVRSAAAAGIGVEGAEDVAQDIMLRLWTLRDNISSARHARGLAVVAARNRALDMLRQSHTVSLTTEWLLSSPRRLPMSLSRPRRPMHGCSADSRLCRPCSIRCCGCDR